MSCWSRASPLPPTHTSWLHSNVRSCNHPWFNAWKSIPIKPNSKTLHGEEPNMWPLIASLTKDQLWLKPIEGLRTISGQMVQLYSCISPSASSVWVATPSTLDSIYHYVYREHGRQLPSLHRYSPGPKRNHDPKQKQKTTPPASCQSSRAFHWSHPDSQPPLRVLFNVKTYLFCRNKHLIVIVNVRRLKRNIYTISHIILYKRHVLNW